MACFCHNDRSDRHLCKYTRPAESIALDICAAVCYGHDGIDRRRNNFQHFKILLSVLCRKEIKKVALYAKNFPKDGQTHEIAQ